MFCFCPLLRSHNTDHLEFLAWNFLGGIESCMGQNEEESSSNHPIHDGAGISHIEKGNANHQCQRVQKGWRDL
jgi:hypothetical protein